jgi:hypothetical protein
VTGGVVTNGVVLGDVVTGGGAVTVGVAVSVGVADADDRALDVGVGRAALRAGVAAARAGGVARGGAVEADALTPAAATCGCSSGRASAMCTPSNSTRTATSARMRCTRQQRPAPPVDAGPPVAGFS